MAAFGQAAMNALTQPDLDFGKLNDEFDYPRRTLLQEGGYGKVYQISRKTTAARYALKVVLKTSMENPLLATNIKREKMALKLLNHQSIIKLHNIYQDRQSVYFLMDLAENGDLFDRVVTHGPFRLSCVQFYAAEIVSALEYLRSVHFVHRDLKAENLLVDVNNHLKLSDFGSAKPIGHSQGTSLVQSVMEKNSKTPGTKLFVAPEVWYQEEVTFGTDYWGLAFTIFLMYSADQLTEFTDRVSVNRYFKFFEEQLWEYCFNNPDPELHDLVYRLLRRNPQDRIGTVNFQDLKNHPFFSQIDWTSLPNQYAPGFRRTRENTNGRCFAFKMKLLATVTQTPPPPAVPAPSTPRATSRTALGAHTPSSATRVSNPGTPLSQSTPLAASQRQAAPYTPSTPSTPGSASYLTAQTASPLSSSGYQTALTQSPCTSSSNLSGQSPQICVSTLTVWLSDAWRQTTSPPPQPGAQGTQGEQGAQGAQGAQGGQGGQGGQGHSVTPHRRHPWP